MSDPYTEATRRERKRIPTFAKVILVAGGLFAAAFVTLAVVGLLYARKMADDWTAHSDEAFADVEIDAGAAEALADVFEGAALTLQGEVSHGEIHIDLTDLDEWVADMEVLVEREIEKGIRIEGATDESGGWLTVRGRDGNTIVELRGRGEGGSLRIGGKSMKTWVDLGDEAGRIPSWVPLFPDARVQRHLFSGDSRKGSFGGVLLVADAEARSVYDWYTENLSRAGLEPSKARMHWDARKKRGRIMARSDNLDRNRQLHVIVSENEDRETSLMLIHGVER